MAGDNAFGQKDFCTKSLFMNKLENNPKFLCIFQLTIINTNLESNAAKVTGNRTMRPIESKENPLFWCSQ